MRPSYVKALQEMEGKSFIHMGHEINVKTVSFKEGHATVKTATGREYGLFDNDKAREFINNCMPMKPVVADEDDSTALAIPDEVNQFTATIDKMITVMERTIDKMEKDPNYVKQATQINKSATQIINAAKLKVETARFLHKTKK